VSASEKGVIGAQCPSKRFNLKTLNLSKPSPAIDVDMRRQRLEVARNLLLVIVGRRFRPGSHPPCAPLLRAVKKTIEEHFLAQSRKVLIIEHAEVLAENLQAHFHRCGWDARIACNGKLAVIAASEFRPELILIDYNLPDMSAFEALDAIRVGHCCSCVLMTGPPDDIVVADAQRRGISRILSKPFVLAELQSLLLASATEFCSKCIENGRRPGRPGCGGFTQSE